MSKFKIGDRVRVRPDLTAGSEDGYNEIVEDVLMCLKK